MGCGGSKSSETKDEIKNNPTQTKQENEKVNEQSNQNQNEVNKKKEKKEEEEEEEKLVMNENKKIEDSKIKTEESIYTPFQLEALKIHNELRKKHNAPPVTLNKELCDIAEKYSKYLASKRTLVHSTNKYKGESLGENIFMCFGSACTGTYMTQAWYDEIKDYDFKKPGWQNGTGHFTQVVWVNCKEVGFGYSKASDNSYYAVGNYYPAGNINSRSYFEENVLPLHK